MHDGGNAGGRAPWWSLLALLAWAAVAHAGDWQRVTDQDGIVVESRAVERWPARELRATAHAAVPPAALMATLWWHDEYARFVPYVKRLDVLRDDGDTKLVYEQVRVPLAKDRDLTARVTRTFAADTATYEMTSTAVPEAGPPARDDHVRVRTSASRWRLAPAADGGTDVTYTLRTDAGGLLPGWIVRLIQRDATVKLIRAMLDRARQQSP